MHICLITTCPSRLFVLVVKSFTDFSSSFLMAYSQFPLVYYDNILIDRCACCLLFFKLYIERRIDMYIVAPPSFCKLLLLLIAIVIMNRRIVLIIHYDFDSRAVCIRIALMIMASQISSHRIRHIPPWYFHHLYQRRKMIIENELISTPLVIIFHFSVLGLSKQTNKQEIDIDLDCLHIDIRTRFYPTRHARITRDIK